ncbi:hypothetical protein BFP72_09125 [Reichenbachiella sp. 5M10]|uniref:HAD family hydrolase n=1 Tax=Reichenbachiella sp. 5M10 TaxID=1889772 RepID=UPI000C14DA12|nr:HAD family phosphatase [Reichenbachiella sp. 5M10]PIB35540.1 hypothetical protein BFP72_09125 [Reichenbachiella sp. 5M10]
MNPLFSGECEAILFDMDGVIIDSEPICREVVDEMLHERGVAITADIHNTYVGQKTSVMWKDFILRFAWQEDYRSLTEESDHRYLTYIEERSLAPIAGILDLLEHFQSLHKKMIVASSATGYNIRLVLDKFGISKYFTGYVSSDEVKQAKPNPDIFLLAAERLGLKAHQCVVIEDSHNGILAAQAAGMQSIGYQNVNSGKQDLSQATVVVNALYEIKDIVC